MLVLLLAACADETYPTCEEAGPASPPATTPTWHGSVRAIVEANCASCHTPGGLGPTPLDTYADAAAYASAMAEAVTSGAMPPWPPADCCRPLQHALTLEPDEVAAIAAWADAGAPEGDPADYVAPEIPASGLSRVDLTVGMPETYTPDPPDGTIDDTRCFLLDWPETERKYVTGLSVRPGVASQVHHALLLVAGPGTVQNFEVLDAADPGPGWSCPGGLVWGYTGWIGGWSPGWTAREMPEGTGQRVEAGSKLILTVHYSLHTGEAQPDQTEIDMMLDDAVDSELMSISVYDPTWLTGGLQIPANDPDVAVSAEVFPAQTRSIVGVNLHMHERGSRGSVGIRHADGSTDCLLQIDDWDHDWQGDYLLEEPLDLAVDDAAWVECHWDNTASNQRIVDGVREEPRHLTWAEDQEMCVAFLTTRAR